MKTIIRNALMIGIASALCACSKNGDTTTPTDGDCLVFTSADAPETYTALDTDNYDGGGKMGFLWTEDDYIVVYDGTKAVQSTKTVLLNGGKQANFTVSGLSTDPGIQYKILYGAPASRLNKTTNSYMVNITPNQTQSAADSSEHIHDVISSGMGTGDCGYAVANSDYSFSLKHRACYFMIGLTKSEAQTGSVMVNKVRLDSSDAISASDLTSGVHINVETGELNHRDTGNTYLFGFGRQRYVELTVMNPITLSATEKHYAYMVSAPLDNIAKPVTFTVTYTVDGVEKTKTITKTPSAFESGKVYKLAVELD